MPLYQNKVKCSAFEMEIIFLFSCKIIENSFSQERLCTWPHFESDGLWNSEVACYCEGDSNNLMY